MLILQGDQGLGKSTAFRTLAEPFFMDTPFRIGDKDSYLSLQGVWLVEFSELESMSKAESTAIKAFVSSVEDRFRPPYGSRMVKMPRRAVLAGTTNSDQFLKDATGDRRMWPVHVTEIRVDLLQACRDQLFAEALHLLEKKSGTDAARYYPTKAEEETLFKPEQERWRMVDAWHDWIADYVEKDTANADDDPNELPPAKRGFFTAQELFTKALHIKAERIDNAKLMQIRVSACMRELGFASAREPAGRRKRGYLRAGWEFSGEAVRRIQVAPSAPQGPQSAPQAPHAPIPPTTPAGSDDDLPI
jgi:predicted P-loop ATPase